jgi:hypothetical protein
MKKRYLAVVSVVAFYIGNSDALEKKQLNFMNQQLSEQLLNQTLALSEPKLVKAQAELLRKHYKALLESGFSKGEAMQIIIAMASRDK